MDAIYPASYAQESFVASTASAINVPAVAHLIGPPDMGRVRQVLDTLVERHGALRTVLTRQPGQPVQQRVSPTGELPLQRHEQRGAPGSVLPAVLLAGSERPFIVQDAALARAELHSLGLDRHVLIVWLHHAISDLVSSQVLSDEMQRLWRGETLAPLVFHMGDFAVQERSQIPTPEQWEFWAKALASVDDQLGVPFPTEPEHVMVRPALPRLHSDVVESLGRLAAAARTTMTAVLAATIIASHADAATSERVVIGLTISNRDHPQRRAVVGCLADQVPLVVDIGGRPTYRELVLRVREALLDTYDNRLPLGLLLPLLGRQAPPVFAVNLNFLVPPARSPREPQTDEPPELPYGIVKRRADPWWLGDAALAYRPRIDRRGLAGEIEGDGLVHGSAEVARHGERFCALLTRAAESPDLQISKLTAEGSQRR